VGADTADCPSIVDGKFSIMIIMVFISDKSLVSAGDEFKTICSNVSLAELSRRIRSGNGNYF
jgi:hypothetical protein